MFEIFFVNKFFTRNLAFFSYIIMAEDVAMAMAVPDESDTTMAIEPQQQQQPDDQTLRASIVELFKTVDLDSMGVATFRKTLEAKFGVSLKKRKDLIVNVLGTLMEFRDVLLPPPPAPVIEPESEVKQLPEAESEEEPVIRKLSKKARKEKRRLKQLAREADELKTDADDLKETKEEKQPRTRSQKKHQPRGRPKKHVNQPGKPISMSSVLQLFIGDAQEISRVEVVKRIWDYIKEHKLQDAADKCEINCDEKLKTVFECDRLNMFSLNKTLAKHILPFVPPPAPPEVAEQPEPEELFSPQPQPLEMPPLEQDTTMAIDSTDE